MPPADHENLLIALSSLLAGLTERQLQHVIRSLVVQQPELLEAVRQEATRLRRQPAIGGDITPIAAGISVDFAAIAREIHKDFQNALSNHEDSYWDEGPYIDTGRILQPHIEKINLLLEAGNGAAAAAVLAAVADQWVIEIDALEDWVQESNEDAFYEAAQELGALLAEALLSQQLAASERRQWLDRLSHWERRGLRLEIAVGALEEGWDYPPLMAVLAGEDDEWDEGTVEFPESADQLVRARLRVLDRQGRIAEYLNLARAAGQVRIYLNRLAHMGATEQAVADAQRLLTSPDDALSLAQVLDEQGQLAAAQAVAEHGLTLTPNAGAAPMFHSLWERARWLESAAVPLVELARWTVALADRVGDPALALRAALLAFAWSYDLADYKLVQQHAGDEWPALRTDLLESVHNARHEDQLPIYLYERMAPEAKAIVDKGGGWSQLAEVLALTGADYPDWSIAKASERAEPIMEAGKSGSYAEAVAWLRQARSIYLQHNRRQEWEEYLATLRSRYSRKYKLIGLLREFN